MKPTSNQVAVLLTLLWATRKAYNAALQERIGAWRWNRRSVRKFDQFKQLTGPEAREMIPGLAEFGIQPFRGALTRLDEAFQHFFRRCRNGETPGFPRFKGEDRWDSITYPTTAGWKVYETGEKGTYGRLYVQGVGHLKVRLAHGKRSIRARGGEPAKLVLRRRGHGRWTRWEATVFYKNVEPLPTPAPSGRSAGIDRGVTALAAIAVDDGTSELVENPRRLRKVEAKLAAAQQRLARHQRGSNRRNLTKGEVVALHRKVANARRDRNHQLSRRLVGEFDTLVLEDLKVANMVRRPKPKESPDEPGVFLPNGAAGKGGLNKSIYDAGWGQLANMMVYKAEEAGRQIVFVDPRYTSQTCPHCGHVDARNRVTQAEFRCCACGHQAHADVNAAINLLDRAGISRPGSGRRSGVQPRKVA